MKSIIILILVLGLIYFTKAKKEDTTSIKTTATVPASTVPSTTTCPSTSTKTTTTTTTTKKPKKNKSHESSSSSSGSSSSSSSSDETTSVTATKLIPSTTTTKFIPTSTTTTTTSTTTTTQKLYCTNLGSRYYLLYMSGITDQQEIQYLKNEALSCILHSVVPEFNETDKASIEGIVELMVPDILTIGGIVEVSPVNDLNRTTVNDIGNTVVANATEVLKRIANVESVFDFINSPMADDLHNRTMVIVDKYSNLDDPAYESAIRVMLDENEAIVLSGLFLEWVALAKQFRLEHYLISIQTTTTQSPTT